MRSHCNSRVIHTAFVRAGPADDRLKSYRFFFSLSFLLYNSSHIAILIGISRRSKIQLDETESE